MEDSAKILLSGLDFAGKTSIMLALNEKKGYIEKVIGIKPTIRVEQIEIDFIGKKVIFWDLGGQERYRRVYHERRNFYYPETDVLFHVIDIQDETRFDASLEYLDSILSFFKQNKETIPVVVSFHKSDPKIIERPVITERVNNLTEKIKSDHPGFDILFQQSSIFDIVSIIKMVSYGLTVLNKDFYNLYELLEEYAGKLNSPGVFLLNNQGIIICKFFKDPLEDEIQKKLSDSLKGHIYDLKEKNNEQLEERK
ncbi:MAG: hypothetical protein EU550_03305, partial [Promethearchaeota archaeon]